MEICQKAKKSEKKRKKAKIIFEGVAKKSEKAKKKWRKFFPWRRIFTTHLYFFPAAMSSGDEVVLLSDGGSGSDSGSNRPQKRRRGSTMTPAKRMAQAAFRGNFFQKGEAMWCIACQCVVDHRQTSFAKGHLKGAKHLQNEKKHNVSVVTPGATFASLFHQPEQAQSSQGSPQGMSFNTPFCPFPTYFSVATQKHAD